MTIDRPILDLREPWPWRPELCNCDGEFVDWFLERYQGGVHSVLHLGPGDHHLVGSRLANAGQNVTALTLSPGEIASFMALSSKNLPLAVHYQVLFGDLYLMDPRLLPLFNVGTLFHVGESNSYEPDRDQILQAILDVMSRRLPDAPLLFYTGSSAWDRVAPLLDRLVTERRLRRVEDYKSLHIYR